jgi:mRNA interferase RelE/StbE
VALEIHIKQSAQDALDEIPKKFRKQIELKIERLKDDPRPAGCEALQGKHYSGLCRIRSGNYRVVYQVRDKDNLIVIIKIGDRRDVYK